ncbi:nucleoside-diphosphate-sugar epimerase [Primorskyibacter sedentarius]|uniref:Nucleoside-diphosphate-sugar epimerase n=2 Tax=Primorskyibacter sedentarius TaxID=745311 RepID=A0A4R3JLD6_9RHOB|nr:nucleoside-diphosphate-sugar epimerase [Primorskyibacter sedentarius]
MVLLGASGKLGTLLREAWQAKPTEGVELIPVYRSRDGAESWQPGEDEPELGKVDAILAMWGVTPGPDANLSENTRLALEAERLGSALGADRVLHCSSAAVYKPGSEPLSEDTQPNPQNAYGHAKLDMETTLLDWQTQHGTGPKPCIMRIGNVGGAESLFAAMSGRAPVTLDRFPEGQGPRRSYIAPEDLLHVVLGLATCALKQLPTIVNVAAPRATSMQEIVQAAGKDVAWRTAPEGANALVELDTARLQKIVPLPQSAADPERLVQFWANRSDGA